MDYFIWLLCRVSPHSHLLQLGQKYLATEILRETWKGGLLFSLFFHHTYDLALKHMVHFRMAYFSGLLWLFYEERRSFENKIKKK